jgi:acyl-CoA thioesterase
VDTESRVWGACTPEEEQRYKNIIRDRVERSPFYRHMGLEVTGLGCGWATFRMNAGENLYNVGGIVHGGAITSIADAASGVALATQLEAGRQRPVTVELKINFCGAATAGAILARGDVVQKGSRIAVCEVEVTQEDRLVAKALSTYMILPNERDAT